MIADIDGVSVTQLKDNLNTKFQGAVAPFNVTAVNYDDITNMFTFSNTPSGAFHITSSSTMNSVLGFESNMNLDFVASNYINTSIVTQGPGNRNCPPR